MKKIVKLTLAVITSFALTGFSTTVSVAGEFTVTGAAKATYAIRGSQSTAGGAHGDNSGKGLGIANEFTLGASGELDNGMAWTYAQDIDNATVQDDASMSLTTDYGIFKVCISECGISAKYKADASAYGVGSDMGLTYTTDTDHDIDTNTTAKFTYGDDIGGWNNVQYHTPAGLLPFGLVVKAAYAPSAEANANASSNSGGAVSAADAQDGRDIDQYYAEMAPIDGLQITASYLQKNGERGYARQGYEAGGYNAKYSYGPVTVGYGKFYVVPAGNTGTAEETDYVQYYENDMYSIGVAANDNLTISYTTEDSVVEKQQGDAATTQKTDSSVESNITAIQAAYTMGGMTLSVSTKDIEKANYTDKADLNETVVAVSMAF
jgi:hypothetical protein